MTLSTASSIMLSWWQIWWMRRPKSLLRPRRERRFVKRLTLVQHVDLEFSLWISFCRSTKTFRSAAVCPAILKCPHGGLWKLRFFNIRSMPACSFAYGAVLFVWCWSWWHVIIYFTLENEPRIVLQMLWGLAVTFPHCVREHSWHSGFVLALSSWVWMAVGCLLLLVKGNAYPPPPCLPLVESIYSLWIWIVPCELRWSWSTSNTALWLCISKAHSGREGLLNTGTPFKKHWLRGFCLDLKMLSAANPYWRIWCSSFSLFIGSFS